MKRTLLTLAMTIATFLGINYEAGAQTTKTYSDYLTVTIDGTTSEPILANIDVSVADNVMTFALKNFCLVSGEDKLGIGNIALDNIALSETELKGVYSFSVTRDITISEGDMEGVEVWAGPGLGEIPIVLNGFICNEKLYVTIDINFALLGQIIKVEVGKPIDGSTMKNKVYQDYLTVTVDGSKSQPIAANIAVTVSDDNKMTFSLQNFCLVSGEDKLGVGNISLDNIELVPAEVAGQYSFTVEQNIQITEGDLEGIDMWAGPSLGDIPIVLKGTICDKKLYVIIDIDFALLGQIIHVEVGTPFDNTILFPAKYTITYLVDGEAISTQELEVGAAITAPEVEAREGYTFTWTDAIPETMPAEDVTINGAYAKNNYIVTFLVGGEEVAKYELEYGSAITVPNVSEREGYTFEWLDEIPSTISDNLTINGQYVPNKYWVQFFVDGVAVYEMEQEYGTPITVPEVEEREGYTFAWEDEIPATVPAEPVLVLGFYTANTYTITFMLDGQEYARYDLEYGTAITAPEVTGDDRYSFSGWEAVPETMPAHDVVINGSLVDGVASMKTNVLGAQYGYNIAGMRVNVKNTRGIIIVNGKKILKR